VKVAGWLIGAAAFGGLVVLAIAGVTGAIAILVTAVAIVGIIAMGNLLGGRTTPNRVFYEGAPATERQRSDEGTGT